MNAWPEFKGSAELGNIALSGHWESAVTSRGREFDLGDSPEVTCGAFFGLPLLGIRLHGDPTELTRDVTHFATALPTGSRCRCRYGRAGSVAGRVGHVPIHTTA